MIKMINKMTSEQFKRYFMLTMEVMADTEWDDELDAILTEELKKRYENGEYKISDFPTDFDCYLMNL